jgi:NitT/TauT family transport system ATP-binding protein
VENIAIGLKAQGVNQTRRRQRARTLAEKVGLADATHLYPQQLSGGMKQRVNLARAFAINPSLLLLDEPFSSLDLGTRGQAQKLVMNWVAEHETTAILVTHDLAKAVLMADHLIVFSARPARMVYCWENEKPPQQRDAAYIYRILAQLQAVPEVAASFSLETPLSLF